MNMLSLVVLASCIVSGSIERSPADVRTSQPAVGVVDMRGVSFQTAEFHGIFRASAPGLRIVVR